MFRLFFAGLIIASVMAIVFLVGCESGGPPSSSNSLPTETDSLKFVMVDGMVGGLMLAPSFQALDLSFALLDSIPGIQATGKQFFTDYRTADGSDIIINSVTNYSFSNGWHILQFEAAFSEDGVITSATMSGIDSLMIFVGVEPVQFAPAESEIDSLRARAHLEFVDIADSASGTMKHLLDVAIARTPTDTILTLNGTTEDSLYVYSSDSASVCEFIVALDQGISDLVFSMNGDGCPESGAITMDAMVDLSCTGDESLQTFFNLDFSGNWAVTATVNSDGSITRQYSDGINDYTTTEPCQPTPPLVSAWRP